VPVFSPAARLGRRFTRGIQSTPCRFWLCVFGSAEELRRAVDLHEVVFRLRSFPRVARMNEGDRLILYFSKTGTFTHEDEAIRLAGLAHAIARPEGCDILIGDERRSWAVRFQPDSPFTAAHGTNPSMKREDEAGRSPARWARYVRQSPIELAASEFEAIVGATGLQVYARNLSTRSPWPYIGGGQNRVGCARSAAQE
jgi:hypothetical protein